MTNYAAFEYKKAWLSSDFGESYARRLFGDEIVDALPRYVRGDRKGKTKGRIVWINCTRGGWVKTGPHSGEPGGASGYVQAKGFAGAALEQLPWREAPETTHATRWYADYTGEHGAHIITNRKDSDQ